MTAPSDPAIAQCDRDRQIVLMSGNHPARMRSERR
jgi:hypothetical protein